MISYPSTMRQWIILISACGILGCCHDLRAASAQTSKSIAAQDASRTYALFKRIVTLPHSNAHLSSINLRPCVVEHVGRLPESRANEELAFLAFEIAYLGDQLRWFPDSLWKKELSDYESERLTAIARNRPQQPTQNFNSSLEERFLVQLATRLNNYKRSHSELPAIGNIYQSPCEFAVIEVTIVTRPRASRVLFINKHSFAVCQEQGIDPYDWNRCDRWTDSGGSNATLFFGRYKVYALWPDGRYALRDMDLATIPDNQGLRRFEIQKPN